MFGPRASERSALGPLADGWTELPSFDGTTVSVAFVAAGLLVCLLAAATWALFARWRRSAAVAAAGGLVVLLVGVGALGSQLMANRTGGADSRSDETRPAPAEDPAGTTTTLQTAHYEVTATVHRNLPQISVPGGGIDEYDGGLLLATGGGSFHRLRWASDADSIAATRLDVRAPLNRDDFVAGTGDDVNHDWFRVADVLARASGDSVRIVISHHFWKRRRGCFVVRVSELEGTRAAVMRGRGVPPWRTIYETDPCLPIKTTSRGNPFAGHQIGGRMAPLGDGRILLTVGDHEFDGWNSAEALPQDSAADYGKTLVVGTDGSAERFTAGHRNPQGLDIDRHGRMWVTEHGPEGGDELNLLVRNANYGWPYRTHGTQYGRHSWPLLASRAGDRRFRPPVYAWVPSIGVSNLVAVEGSLFDGWRDDLLVASLRAQHLFRLRLDGDRVAYAEPIRIGRRIRDIVEIADGRIILWTDGGEIVSLAPAAGRVPEALVFQRCAGCHALSQDRAGWIGPELRGVVGRSIASVEGYDYSPALDSMAGRWTGARLDRFLADPDRFAPGTAMAVEGIADPAERRRIIQYLQRNR